MRPLLGISWVALVLGCASARPPVLSGARFDALRARDLPAFEQRIALDARLTPGDDWLTVARAWADLVSCRPIGEAAPREPSARFVWSTLRLEQARHDRLRAEPSREALEATWLRHLADPAFFRREPAAADPRWIRWLPERETWLDELPAARAVPSACGERRADLVAENLGSLLALEHARATEARERAETLEHGDALLDVLRWRLLRHEASLAHRRALLDEAAAPELRAEASRLLGLVLALPIPPGVTPVEHAEARLLAAVLEDRAGAPERALAIVRPALELEVDDALHHALRYQALSAARRSGDLELARTWTDPLPPRSHPLHDATAFEAARTLAELGRLDELLRVATSALRDRPTGTDPHRRATLTLALAELARTELDARTIEIVEDLGPRQGLLDRMAELTVLALDQGEAAIADAAARWLHAHDRDARGRRQYAAWIALAALVRDDEATFTAAIERIVTRSDAVRRAVGRAREADFFRPQDRALTLLLAEALPRIAEWGDDASGRARRTRWLTRILDHIQGFLRETPGSLERQPLLELYRVASAMLRDAPRGYPEHVARTGAPPLVLGQVHLPWPEPAGPAFMPRITPPEGLAVLPRGEAPEVWSLAWPDGGREDSP